MEPQELNLGSGWWFSPITMTTVLLIILSLKHKINHIHISDILLIIFYLFAVISFIFFSFDSALFGLISLFEIIIAYFLVRINLNKSNIFDVSAILVSMSLFQSIIGFIQYLLKHPIGILAESSTFSFPFGLTTPEDVNIYRLSGTFVHPNNFAAVILAILSFLFFYKFNNKYLNLMKFLPVFVLFFTYSRASWIFFVIMVIYLFIKNKGKLLFKYLFSKNNLIIAFVLLIISVYIFIPLFFQRIDTFSQALSEGGSFDIRTKLFVEGINLVSQYPLTGVGLNRSMETYASSPITDIFNYSSKIYRIHNTFLEIATEVGVPAMVVFILFLLFVVKHYMKSKIDSFKTAAFLGLIGLVGMSMLNPFFHSSQFRLFFLLSAIILV